MVKLSTLILLFLFDNNILPAPVAEKVVVSGLGVPYSVGFLYCFSVTLLFAEVVHIQLLISLFCSIILAIPIDNVLVEHAAYTPI